MPKINISVGGKWHFYDIVVAANEMGALNHFYTSIYFNRNSVINSFIGKRLNLKNRSHNEIPIKKVVSNFKTEVIPKLLNKLKIYNEEESLRGRCTYFDNWTEKIIDECDIFHSQDGFCLKTAKKVKMLGSKFICDRGIVAASYLEDITEEYKKLGIQRKYADVAIKDRTYEEHELSDLILVPTETVKDSLITEHIAPGKIKVVPYGVDLSFFKKLPAKDTPKFRVLFVGEISVRKGCHFLLQSWKQLDLKNAELILIGNIEKGFEKIIKKYDGDYIHIPYTNQEQLINFYSSANVLVLPSLAEGSARVIYEAMACELPVIYSNMAGSVARDKIDGFEVKTHSTEEIIDKLLFFYENRDKGVEMGKSAENWIKNYSKEKYRRNIKGIYEEVLKSR